MSRVLARQLLLAALTIVLAHALTVALVRVLPSSAEQLLGIFGVREEALRTLAEINPPRSYASMVRGLLHFDFGITADGVSVAAEILEGLGHSVPRLASAILISFAAATATALLILRTERLFSFGLSYLVFFPPYGVPFILLAGLLVSGIVVSQESPIVWLAGVVAIAAGPAAMLTVQAGAVMKRHLASAHAAFLLANGVQPRRLRFLILANVGVELTPTFEKVVAGALTSLMFSELVLGLPGVGNLAVRAVRRSDLELLSGVVLTFCVLICAARIASALARHAYGADQ